jgi:hypothetical protein
MHFQKLKMHFQNLGNAFPKSRKSICTNCKSISKILGNAFVKIENPFAKI